MKLVDKRTLKMSRRLKGFQEPVQDAAASTPLPADHVLGSGAVIFPGVFDQHGCPLIIFPVDGQNRLTELSKAEVVDFINYFQCLHNKKQETGGLVSVVADLRHALLSAVRFIAETLLLLELQKRTVYSVYIIQPRKKDAAKLLLKLLTPSKSFTVSFRKILLRDVTEVSNYIDRSQLPASLGGYFRYCHQSWVGFIKEIDAFVQEFLSVVQRLPSCILTLQALSRLPLPTCLIELQQFCYTNEAKFQQLRRKLGLDELLRHCECVIEKLRCPDEEPCYQAMAGTTLFTHTTFDMLQNHSRITAAVEKVELLWQQAFSKAHLQLQVFQLRNDALQITEKIEALQEKLELYRTEIAKDSAKATLLLSDFETSLHTPAVALVRCAEDVIHTLAEILPLEARSRECWAMDLEKLKENLHSAVHVILQTLQTVSTYHHYYSKANNWCNLVLCENFLQELLSSLHEDTGSPRRQRRNWATIPAWRRKLSSFLKNNPSPDMEELLYLAHLSNAIPDDEIQQAGKQVSQRCMTLRKLLISSGPVSVGELQLAMQWQYELLRSCHIKRSSDAAANKTSNDFHRSPPDPGLTKCENGQEAVRLSASPSHTVSERVSAERKPPSLSSFDSGFDGAGSSPLEASGGKVDQSGLTGSRDSMRSPLRHPQMEEDNISSISDCEDHIKEFDLGSVGNTSRATIQIIPKVEVDSLNFEITVKRSAALPGNPWLSLPVDDLENSYTVTIIQNATPQKGRDVSASIAVADQSDKSGDRSTQRDALYHTEPRGPQNVDWMLHSQSVLADTELSPISNILSSTITDETDKSICTTEGTPTLLWDSYDLHDEELDGVEGVMDLSLNDWHVKEQEGLKEVEKILERTGGILKEEEDVLAQEAVLDALLRSDDKREIWPLWDSEDQEDHVQEAVSSSELAEVGGLEEPLQPTEPNGACELRSAEFARGCETCADELNTEVAEGSIHSRLDLLAELRNVNILDELIAEENLKIHEFRLCRESQKDEPSEKAHLGVRRMTKEKEAFQLQLEAEKREVEKLEKSLDKECKVERNKDKVGELLSSSVMEKSKDEDQLSCELFSDSISLSEITDSTSLLENAFKPHDTWQIETFRAPSDPDVAKEQLDLSSGQNVTGCEAEQSVCDRTTLNGASDLKPLSDVAIHSKQPTSMTEVDESGEDAEAHGPKGSVVSEMRVDEGAFGSDGKPIVPLELEPRKSSLPVNHNLTEVEHPHSTQSCPSPSLEVQEPGYAELDSKDETLDAPVQHVSPDLSERVVLHANVKEHCNNNNNRALQQDCDASLSELASKDERKTSVGPAHVLQVNVHPAEEILQSLSQIHPDQPLEFDPGGGDDLLEDLPDARWTSEAVRISHNASQGNTFNDNLQEMANFKTPIVLDTGSGFVKAGFADQELPSIIFPTIIGMPKYEEIMNGNLEKETYIGHDAQHMRGVLVLKHPMKNGIIRNWDEMEKIWHHTFQQLFVDPEDHPVLLTEAAMNPLENRQRMVEMMFECFNVPLTYVAMQAVLALYAAGRTTGVVFDSGDGVSHSVPVFEGYCLPHAVQRFPLAGGDVTMHLKKLLQEQGVCMRTTAEREIVREMKEKCCYVALNYKNNLSQEASSCTEMPYTMPDGQIVTLDAERFRAPEILFKPELIGRDHYGMHESVFKSILSSDIDLRRRFLENIVLSGGNTLLPGLPERLQAEIKGLVPADMGVDVHVTSPKDRDFSVWSGGAVLANLPTFSSAWISQEEYEEYGPQIVFRKCF